MQSELQTKLPMFRLSVDSTALALELEKASIGNVLSYKELSTHIGRNVQTVGHSSLETARLLLQREKKRVFGIVRGVGLIRLSDNEIVDLSDKARDSARRHARRTAKKLICVDYENLTREKQTKHNAALSMFGTLAEMTTAGSQKRLEARIEITGTRIPAAKAAMAALGFMEQA